MLIHWKGFVSNKSWSILFGDFKELHAKEIESVERISHLLTMHKSKTAR